jgi:outer membrane protein OmpA-like peptidoglycan-associated protein
MKTTLALLLATAAGCSSSGRVQPNAPIGPDFVSAAPKLHIDSDLVASPAMNRIEPLDVVAFALDNADLTAAPAAQIDRAAHWLMRHPDHNIILEGHTDRSGVENYNDDLSVRRIDAVRQRLLAWRIPESRIVMLAYGERGAADPDNPNDRRVVMFSTRLVPEQVIAMQTESRDVVVANWVSGGQLHEIQPGRATPSVVGRR